MKNKKVAIRYGLKDVLRTPLKTILFIILLTIVVIFLSAGIGMWSVAEGMLTEADRVFLTAGQFEYVGKFDEQSVENNEGLISANRALEHLKPEESNAVKLFEKNNRQKALVEGFIPTMWDMNYSEKCFLVIKVQTYLTDHDMWMVRIKQDIYSEWFKESDLICIKNDEITKDFAMGQEYVVYGDRVSYNGMPFEAFLPVALEGEQSFCVQLTKDFSYEDFLNTEQGKLYLAQKEKIEKQNQAVDIVTTKQVEAVDEFHIGEYTLMEGDFFDTGDYEKGDSCIMPSYMAEKMGAKVGDEITLTIMDGVKGKGMHECYDGEESILCTESFRIAGLYDAAQRKTPIYIADAGQDWISCSDNDPVFGRVVLENRDAEQYIEDIEEMLPENVLFKYSDQGYRASVSTIKGMLRTARMLTAAFGMVAILITSVFLYIRVKSSKKSLQVLNALGSGKMHTLLHFVVGNMFVTTISCVVGGSIGYLLSALYIGKVYEKMSLESVFDYRFSINGYGKMSSRFDAVPQIRPIVFIVFVLVMIMVISLAGSFVFFKAIQKNNGKNRNNRKKKLLVTKTYKKERVRKIRFRFDFIPGFSLRYAIRNIFRNGAISLVVPVLIMVLLVFLSVFDGWKQGFSEELSHVYEDIPVTFQLTDVTGRKVDELVISDLQVDYLKENEYVQELWSSNMFYAKSLGKPIEVDQKGIVDFEKPLEIPQGSFAFETMKEQWKGMSTPLVATDNIYKTPQLIYESDLEITWIEGFSYEKFLLNELPSGEYYGCIAPSYFLEQEHLKPGDRVGIAIPIDTEFNIVSEIVEIAGVYESSDETDAIFMTTEAIDGKYYSWYARSFGNIYVHGVLNDRVTSAGGILCNTKALSSFKDELEQQYDVIGTVGKYRKWIMIDDKVLYETIDNLTTYIWYMDLLYPVVLGLIVILGFVVSNILLKIRAREIAMLRSMGCSNRKIFCTILTEYILLVAIGCASGIAISGYLPRGQHLTAQVILLISCYFVGTIIALIKNIRSALISALKSEEE